MDIILQADELIKSLYEKGRENSGKRNDLTSGSIEPQVKHNTNEEIANQNVGKCRHKSIYVLVPS